MGAPHPDSRRLAVTQRLLWLCNPLVQQAWEKSGLVVLLGRGSLSLWSCTVIQAGFFYKERRIVAFSLIKGARGP